MRLIVRGHVQGVFFRDFARNTAISLGLAGYVKNMDDGSVSVVAEGPGEALEKLVLALNQGPPDSRVESLEMTVINPTGKFSGFDIRH